jgi:hypothetical protein
LACVHTPAVPVPMMAIQVSNSVRSKQVIAPTRQVWGVGGGPGGGCKHTVGGYQLTLEAFVAAGCL